MREFYICLLQWWFYGEMFFQLGLCFKCILGLEILGVCGVGMSGSCLFFIFWVFISKYQGGDSVKQDYGFGNSFFDMRVLQRFLFIEVCRV